ncbi:MAG: hypothetical protein GXO77_13330 [Calditrichaeota bacterium]|nr:hypothetical protein [Calditrichota bacterium]
MSGSSSSARVFTSRGNIELLSQKKIALFASREVPREIYGSAVDFFNVLIDLPICIAGGWQSPLEKTLYKHIKPAQKANIIHYFAREINGVRLTQIQQHLLNEKKLLMIAPETTSLRPSQNLIKKRDELIFSQTKQICFLYIRPGGRLESYFNLLDQTSHSVYFLDHPLNRIFLTSNVVELNPENIELILTE